jgi:hypothetical protein
MGIGPLFWGLCEFGLQIAICSIPALLKGVVGLVIPDAILHAHLLVDFEPSGAPSEYEHAWWIFRFGRSGFEGSSSGRHISRGPKVPMAKVMRASLFDGLPTDQGIVGTENHPKYGPRNGPMNCPDGLCWTSIMSFLGPVLYEFQGWVPASSCT